MANNTPLMTRLLNIAANGGTFEIFPVPERNAYGVRVACDYGTVEGASPWATTLEASTADSIPATIANALALWEMQIGVTLTPA